jgi:hypothetical protein
VTFGGTTTTGQGAMRVTGKRHAPDHRCVRRAVTARADHDERGRVFLGRPAQPVGGQPFLHAADDVESVHVPHHVGHKSLARRGRLFAEVASVRLGSDGPHGDDRRYGRRHDVDDDQLQPEAFGEERGDACCLARMR